MPGNMASPEPRVTAATLRDSRATANSDALQEPPYVPHLFVQRIDALPESALDEVLAALELHEEESFPEQRQGWLHALLGDKPGVAPVEQRSPRKIDRRKLLQRHRQQEIAADADTPDFSSEPYDTIPRQVELQWHVYAKLYPEEAAAKEKLANLTGLQRSDSVNTRENLPADGAASTSSLARTPFGSLPSVAELQRTLGTLVGADPRTAAGTKGPTAPGADSNTISTTAARHTTSIMHVPSPGEVAPASSNTAYLEDPVFQQLSSSLDYWYELHRRAVLPLRRGRRARVLALRGVGIPAEWEASLCPEATESQGGRGRPGGPLRWCAAVGNAAAGILGLRNRPRVWEVRGAGSCALVTCSVVDKDKGEKGKSRELQGIAGARGLVAAQAAARAMAFTLRRMTLLSPEWL